MRKKIFIIGILFTFLISCVSCSFFDVPLTDQTIHQYITAYKNLRKAGPEFASQTGKISMDTGIKSFGKIEKIVKNAGFKDFGEFMKVNAKIGTALSAVQGRSFMNDMKNMPQSKEFKELMKKLDDPNIPKETRDSIRAEIKKASETFDKGKNFAEPVLGAVDSFTDKKALELVKKYRKEILEAYTGIKQK